VRQLKRSHSRDDPFQLDDGCATRSLLSSSLARPPITSGPSVSQASATWRL